MHTRELVEELADIAESLAPEHGRATYGEPLRGLTPGIYITRRMQIELLTLLEGLLLFLVESLKNSAMYKGLSEFRSRCQGKSYAYAYVSV